MFYPNFLFVILIVLFPFQSLASNSTITELKASAARGNLNAQFNLAVNYIRSGDYSEAKRWFELAAIQGDVEAMLALGELNSKEIEGLSHTPEDYLIAEKWFRKAAEKGNARAQQRLGWMYHYGIGIPVDKKEAVIWYKKAFAQGNALAALDLGWIFDEGGGGIQQNYKEAFRWFKIASEKGLADAQLYLGLAYVQGKGVTENRVKAYKWWLKAAQQGESLAKKNLTKLCQKTPWVCK